MFVSDWEGSGSIFKEISLLIPELVTPESAATLDVAFTAYMGTRIIYKPFASMSVPSVAEMLVLKHAKTWFKYFEVENLEGVGDITITEETINSADVRNNATESIDLVAAYNEVELIDNAGNNTNALDSSTGEVVRYVKTTVAGVDARFNQLNLLNSNGTMNQMLYDVASSITLSIYN